MEEEAPWWVPSAVSISLPRGIAHGGHFDPCAVQAGVGRSNEGETEAGTNVATDNRVRLLPLVGELLGESAENGFGLAGKDAVDGDYEWSEVASLGVAGLEVFALLTLLSLNPEWSMEPSRRYAAMNQSNGYDYNNHQHTMQ